MKKRKSSLIFSEFWGTYAVLCSVILASLPFLIIFAARGIVFPLAFAFLFLIISAGVCFMYALNSATLTIDKENREIMQALRGTK